MHSTEIVRPVPVRRMSEAARLLRLWVRIPPWAWMFVCCECCVLSGRGLCNELITRPEECYRLWCVVVCDLETSWMNRSWPNEGCRAKNRQTKWGRDTSARRSLRSLISKFNIDLYYTSYWGCWRWCSWLRHCATGPHVAIVLLGR